MIMAGRGKRLEMGEKPKSAGTLALGTTDGTPDIIRLKKTITQTNLGDLNSDTLKDICNLFNQLCSSKETMKDLLHDLHENALSEADFGEKLVIILEQMSNLEINGTLLRNELLTLIQKDFEMKDTMYKSDPKKFLNAVTLLGGVYNKIKVCGAPIAVLGIALLEYFDLLVKGGEEELKTLTKQILINGNTLFEAPTYDKFAIKLRDILINGSSSAISKCWTLLIIELISNDLKPLKGPMKEFYVSNLKEDYTALESLSPITNFKLNFNSSPQSIKSSESTSPRNDSFDTNLSSARKDFNKKFSQVSEKTERSNFKGKKDKGQISPGKNLKRDNWKPNRGPSASEHDDRFEKEENYYGVQTPRQAKPENRKFANDKSKRKEFESKTNQSPDNNVDVSNAQD